MTARKERATIFNSRISDATTWESITSDNANDIENAVEAMRESRRGFIIELDRVNERSRNKWTSIKTLFETKKEYIEVEELWMLLDNDEDLELLVLIEETHESGMTLLHIALDNEAPQEVIQILLEADVQKSSLYYAKVINKIIDKHLLPMDNEDARQRIAQEWIDKHLATALLLCVTSDSFEKSKNVKNKDHASVPVQLHRYLATSVMKDKVVLQEILNCHAWQRRAVAVTLFDFYATVVTITLFMIVSSDYLEDVRAYQGWEIDSDEIGQNGERRPYYIALYFMICFFFIRECLECLVQGFNYIFAVWNVLDILKIVLLLISVIWMQSGATAYATRDNPKDFIESSDISDGMVSVGLKEVYSDARVMLTITGGVLCLSLVAFLRNAFLPFSSFVSGTANILVTLIPFFIITIIVLLAFMYMYYVQRFDEGVTCDLDKMLHNYNLSETTSGGVKNIFDSVCICEATEEGSNFCEYSDSFYDVFGYLAGGPDETVDILDIVCGCVLVIIFLNVVIAIVSNAWDEATDERAQLEFWLNRISYFYETRSISNAMKSLERKVNNSFPFTYIDELCSDKVHVDALNGMQDKSWKRKTRAVIKIYFIFMFKYLVCFPLGTVTFGLFWPKSMRQFIFSNTSEPPNSKDEDIKKLTQQVEDLKAENIKMEVKLETETSNNKDDDIKQLTQKLENLKAENIKMEIKLESMMDENTYLKESRNLEKDNKIQAIYDIVYSGKQAKNND